MQRRIVLLFAVIVAGGPLVLTSGYAIHLRSDGHRREVESELSRFFELPCEVRQIRGLTFSSRAFEDVVIHLPDRRDRLFTCKTAIWHEEKSGGRLVNRLELQDGILMLGSDRWHRDDYRTVFESGMGHDFAELHLTRVDLAGFEFEFRRGDLVLNCKDATGVVDMDGSEEGIARLHAYKLNDCRIDAGVSINARFKAHNGVEVTDVRLELPTVPLSSIGLESALKGEITTGSFSGMIRYSNPDLKEPPEVRVSGRLRDAELSELTRSVPFGPFVGRIDVNVESARLSRSMLTHLRGGGSVENLSFAGFAPLMGLKSLSGQATFSFNPVHIELGQIQRLRVAGSIHGVQLEEIANAFAEGEATGLLTIRVNNIDIDHDVIQSADLEIIATPPKGEPGTIDRTLLLNAARSFLNLSWPESLPESLLPANLEYAEFGVRLLVRDNQLRILGTHGPGNEVILTIKVFGQTFGVVKQPANSIDLTPFIEAALNRARTYDPRRVGEILNRHKGVAN